MLYTGCMIPDLMWDGTSAWRSKQKGNMLKRTIVLTRQFKTCAHFLWKQCSSYKQVKFWGRTLPLSLSLSLSLSPTSLSLCEETNLFKACFVQQSKRWINHWKLRILPCSIPLRSYRILKTSNVLSAQTDSTHVTHASRRPTPNARKARYATGERCDLWHLTVFYSSDPAVAVTDKALFRQSGSNPRLNFETFEV